MISGAAKVQRKALVREVAWRAFRQKTPGQSSLTTEGSCIPEARQAKIATGLGDTLQHQDESLWADAQFIAVLPIRWKRSASGIGGGKSIHPRQCSAWHRRPVSRKRLPTPSKPPSVRSKSKIANR